jgi:hypothetical protein
MQQHIKSVFSNPYLADGSTFNTADGNIGPCLWTEQTFEDIVAMIEGHTVPLIAVELMKELVYIIKYREGYDTVNENILAQYVIPWGTAITSTNAQYMIRGQAAANVNIMENQALAQSHMDKFGIKYTKFSRSMIDEIRVISYDSPKTLQTLQLPLILYAAANEYLDNGIGVGNANSAALDWSAYTYFFTESIDEAKILLLRALFLPYDATYNPYGGLLATEKIQATQNRLNLYRCKYTGYSTHWYALHITTDAVNQQVLDWRNIWNYKSGDYEPTIAGNFLTANAEISNATYDHWPFAYDKFRKTGISQTIYEQALLNYIEDLLFGK